MIDSGRGRALRAVLDEVVPRYTAIITLVLLGASFTSGGCTKSDGLAKLGQRTWGREKLDEEVKARAMEPIDAYQLDANPAIRQRILTMSFQELVARFGFLRLESTASFDLSRNGLRIPVFEKTVVEHGLDGTFRVVQQDKDEHVTREFIYNNGVLYIRNGNTGKMRVQGTIGDSHLKLREEAWAPLKAFTGYFGPRLGLRQVGGAKVGRRRAVRYRFGLLDGPELVAVPGIKGHKAPVALSGNLYVDEKTGIPLKVKLRGELRVPVATDAQPDAEPGILKVFYTAVISPAEGKELKPESYVPTIAHRKVELDPLRFLEEDTRTSTVIGGGDD